MKLRVYEEKTNGIKYPGALAYSIHFELETDKEKIKLNRGYGVLYPKAEIRKDNTIDGRGVRNPRIFREDGKLVVFGDYCDAEGNVFSEGDVYVWKLGPGNLISDEGLKNKDEYVKYTESELEISASEEEVLCEYLLPKSRTEMIEKGAKEGKKFKFPLTRGYADPTLFKWEGKWYFLATNDNTDAVGMFLRCSDTIDGLFEDGYEESIILPYDEERELIQTFWAPEFHVIGTEAYILFAVGGKKWAPQSHMMRLKKGANPMNPDSWEDPVRVMRKDGSFLCENGITLDMTYIKAKKSSYLVWSERYGIGTPLDSGSMLYIATIDESNPLKLTSDPVLLTRPLYGWENQSGTINNEGPYALYNNGKVYLAYSGGAAGGYSYTVGFLTADDNDDLLDVSNWKKGFFPAMSAFIDKNEEGPGHNSFFCDDEGNTYVAYHAQLPGEDYHRNSAIRQVFFAGDGRPLLDCI